jgi:hypothetical protein
MSKVQSLTTIDNAFDFVYKCVSSIGKVYLIAEQIYGMNFKVNIAIIQLYE